MENTPRSRTRLVRPRLLARPALPSLPFCFAGPQRFALLGLAIAVLATTACDDAGGGGGPSAFLLSLSGSEALAAKTCEGGGQSGEADVYHRVQLLEAGPDDDEFSLLNETDYRLIQLGLDQRTTFGLASTNALSRVEDGHQIMFAIDAYENDPGGPSVVDAHEWVWQYDAHRACWWDMDQGSSSAAAPCISVPVDESWGTYDFFYLYDQAQYCEVRFLMYLGFRRVPLAALEP